MTLSLTVVILTKNEARDLPGCLDSVRSFSDDCIVLDSGSTDGTREIASNFGAAVYEHPFTGFGDQRNWAIDQIPHRYNWVLHLDADERPTEAFIGELGTLLDSEPGEAGFFVPSKLMLGDQWLRYCGGYPVYQVRLFHRQRLRFANHGHGQREVTDGRIGYMREPYLHHAFSKGLRDWLEKHARYAAAEAIQADAEPGTVLEHLGGCFSADPIRRRRAAKQLSFSLPARAQLRWFQIMILKRGFLDGRAGLAYARMMAAYESMFAAYRSGIKAGLEIRG